VQEMQFIECVAERDIDLLLLEEYHVSAGFRSWLIGQAFEPDFYCGQFIEARHSVNHITLGESDLVVLFADGAGNRIAQYSIVASCFVYTNSYESDCPAWPERFGGASRNMTCENSHHDLYIS